MTKQQRRRQRQPWRQHSGYPPRRCSHRRPLLVDRHQSPAILVPLRRRLPALQRLPPRLLPPRRRRLQPPLPLLLLRVLQMTLFSFSDAVAPPSCHPADCASIVADGAACRHCRRRRTERLRRRLRLPRVMLAVAMRVRCLRRPHCDASSMRDQTAESETENGEQRRVHAECRGCCAAQAGERGSRAHSLSQLALCATDHGCCCWNAVERGGGLRGAEHTAAE